MPRQTKDVKSPGPGGATAGGDRFFEPDITLQYPKLFPNDVAFVIGQSKPNTDWFFAHVPHNIDPDARVRPFRGVSGQGRATPYTIRFQMDRAATGSAILRLAICGTGTRTVEVQVNNELAGQIALGPGEGVISRHQIQGLWYQREFKFDATMLKVGPNTLTLTVPAGNVTAGVVYDYLRLELSARQCQSSWMF